MFFHSSVGGHNDLFLALYVLTWTMYLWRALCKISVCYFDVQSFVLTYNRWNSSQIFLRVCLLDRILSLAQISFPFFFLTWLLIELSSTISWTLHQKHRQQKQKIGKWDHIKNLLHNRGNNQQNEKATYGIGENICKSISDKGLIFKILIYKELLQLNSKNKSI